MVLNPPINTYQKEEIQIFVLESQESLALVLSCPVLHLTCNLYRSTLCYYPFTWFEQSVDPSKVMILLFDGVRFIGFVSMDFNSNFWLCGLYLHTLLRTDLLISEFMYIDSQFVNMGNVICAQFVKTFSKKLYERFH